MFPYVSQTYDEQRWAVAAHAAKRVIDMDMYELHTVKVTSTRRNCRPMYQT